MNDFKTHHKIEQLKECFKQRFLFGKRTLYNWVVKVSLRMRTVFRSMFRSRIFVEWSSCTVENFLDATKCYKCQTYGQVQKFCMEKEITCILCSKYGHKVKEYPNKKAGKRPTCPVCKK